MKYDWVVPNSDPIYVYFTYFGFEPTVIESQVLVPAKKLSDSGLSVHFIFMERVDKWVSHLFGGPLKNRYQRLNDKTFICLPRVPKNFLFLNSFLLQLTIWVRYRGRPVYLHSRGFQATQVALHIKKPGKFLSVLGDIRGVESAEHAYVKPNHKFWTRHLVKIQNNVLKNADRLTGVSQAMIEFLRKTHENRTIEYIPCCVDVPTFISSSEKRIQNRKRLGLADKLVLVYAGQVTAWHLPDRIVQTAAKLAELDPRIFFMGLTPGVSAFENIINNYSILKGRSFVKKATFAEIPDLLSSADIGIILREENPLNTYACPTKFGEYLAAGLHVISTKGVADIERLIQAEGIGTILSLDATKNGDNVYQSILRLAENSKERIERSQAVAKKVFTWDNYVPKMIENFKETTHNPK